jgi:hypothetical protein
MLWNKKKINRQLGVDQDKKSTNRQWNLFQGNNKGSLGSTLSRKKANNQHGVELVKEQISDGASPT